MAEDGLQQQLDDKVVEYFNTLDNIYCCQKELEDHMKEGYFNLSKARYSMGVKAVGALQFDGREMQALTTVDVDENSDGDLFSLTKNQPGDSGTQSKSPASSTTGVRKRGQGQGRDGSKEEDFDDMDWINDQIKKMGLGSLDGLDPKAKPQPKPVCKQDPLKWFGVLVPQTLRSSQSHFQSATDLTVEIVNLRHKLFDIKDQYLALKERENPNEQLLIQL